MAEHRIVQFRGKDRVKTLDLPGGHRDSVHQRNAVPATDTKLNGYSRGASAYRRRTVPG